MAANQAIPAVTAALEEAGELAPPRFRWLKRVLVGGIVMWIAIFLAWLILNHNASRRLEAQIRLAQERGEAVWPADFRTSRIPPDANAATHFLRASAAYRELILQGNEQWLDPIDYPLSDRAIKLHERHLADNAATLSELRALRHCPVADFELFVSADPFEREQQLMRLFNGMCNAQDLAELLRDAALVSAARGDHAAAIEYLRDELALSRTIDQAPLVSGPSWALQCELVTCESVSLLARQLKISATTRPASRATVAGLIADLLDERRRTVDAHTALLGERARVISFVQEPFEWQADAACRHWTAVRRPLPARLVHFVTGPYERLCAANNARDLGTAAGAIGCPDWPTAKNLLWPTVVWSRSPASYLPQGEWLVSYSQSYASWIPQMMFQQLMLRRLSGTLLALRMYQLDHAGALPARLAELEGHELPAVPLDCFAFGGKPIGYVRKGRACFVYSVWTNGIDDVSGGWTPQTTDHRNWNSPDYVLMLDPAAMSAAGTTTAVTGTTTSSTR